MFSSTIIPGLQNIQSLQNLQSLQIPTSQAVVSSASNVQMNNGGDKDEKEDVKPPTSTAEGSFQGYLCGESFLVRLSSVFDFLLGIQ